MIFIDTRSNTWWAGVPHRHWGQKLYRSPDEGDSWQQVETPKYPPQYLDKKTGKSARLRLIWCMAEAGFDRPNALWLGTEPGGLFFSDNDGDTWTLNDALWQHRLASDLWFGAGKDEPFLHSIVVDPRESAHLYTAVSCAGVYETRDFGATWQPRNEGLKATYLPNPNAPVGHDPHRLLASFDKNNMVLWQQNHCGIFRSTDEAAQWQEVSDVEMGAFYGFSLAIDDKNAERAWVIPAQSDELRIPDGLALQVCRTDDGGKTWQSLRKGLPQHYCFDLVFRHAFDKKEAHLAFGTTSGNVYWSENDGTSWQNIASNLARIDAVLFVF